MVGKGEFEGSGMMLEKYCPECDEIRVLLPIKGDGMCPYCGGSPRDCSCIDECQECEGELIEQGAWIQ